MSDSSEMHERGAAYNPPPEAAAPEPWSHPWYDQLGLLYHKAIAAKIRARPELRDVAVSNISRWIARNDYPASVVRALERWRELLTSAPVEELIAVMTDPSERGHQMRQNTPFAGILGPEERRRIRDEHEKTSTR